MKKEQERIDKLLCELDLVETRSKAKALIMAGSVYVDGERIDKAGTQVSCNARVEVRGQSRFVSRGGEKLQAAIDSFSFNCQGLTVIDVGASTGGFTDCVLQNGASHVFAVDVGYGQLAWKLRQDSRVTVLERENIRYLAAEKIAQPCQLAVIDCSFISLRLVLPNTRRFLDRGAHVIALIKPQFEAGRDGVGKGGVVRDAEIRQRAIEGTIATAEELGFKYIDGIDCPVHGPAGNVEYLCLLKLSSSFSLKEESSDDKE